MPGFTQKKERYGINLMYALRIYMLQANCVITNQAFREMPKNSRVPKGRPLF